MVSLLHGLTESEPLLAFASPPDQQEAADILERIRADLHPGQLAFVDDQDTEILGLCAGYGSGKTHALAAKTCALALANQGHTGCVMEPTGRWFGISGLTTSRRSWSAMRSPIPSGRVHCPR